MAPMPQPEGGSAVPKQAVHHRRSLPLYIGSGGVATACHYAFTVFTVEVLGMQPVAASAGGFVVGAVAKYYLNYTYAFRSTLRHSHAMARYVASIALLFVLNAAIFAGFQEGLGMYYMLAQVITTGLLILPGYFLSRRWVFRRS
jgi:putative flippase GtrA